MQNVYCITVNGEMEGGFRNLYHIVMQNDRDSVGASYDQKMTVKLW